MRDLFLDLRWLRKGNIRGIGAVSLAYTEYFLDNNLFNITLITTNSSKDFLKNYLIKKDHCNINIATSTIIYGDLFGLSSIIKKYKTNNQPPIYIGFGNTMMLDLINKTTQYNFIHDFSWHKAFRKKLDNKFVWEFGLADFYVSINNFLLNSRSNRFIYVSDYVSKSIPNKEIYLSRGKVIDNPIIIPEIKNISNSDTEDAQRKSITWVGGNASVKNKKHLFDVIELLNFENKENQFFSLIFNLIGDIEIPKELIEEQCAVKINNFGIVNHNEMCKVIKSSNALIVPSYTESFSIPAVIANNFKKIIIGTENSPFKDWFGDNYFPITGTNKEETKKAILNGLNARIYEYKNLEFDILKQGELLVNDIIDSSPIVIFHLGKQKYFKSAVKLINKAGLKPIIIGDSNIFNQSSAKFFTKNIQDKSISNKWQQFLINYKHLHDDESSAGQLLCYERWYVILDKMKSLKIKSFWHLDSDLAIFKDFLSYKKDIENSGFTSSISIPHQKNEYQMSASSHASYWSTGDLESFIDFMSDGFITQKDKLMAKWEFHNKNNISGGVCDMTFQYLWTLKLNKSSVNIANIDKLYREKWTFNDNINIGVDQTNFGFLNVIKKSGQYFVKEIKCLSKPLPFLHCQGRAKPLLILLNYNIPISISVMLLNIYKQSIILVKKYILKNLPNTKEI